MKFLTYTIAGIMLSMSATSFAQETSEMSNHHGEKRIEMLKEQLSLTDDQVTKLEALKDDFKMTRQKIKADQTTSEEVKHSQLKALKEQHKSDFEAVLTADQLTKLNELKAEKKAQKEKTLEEKAEAKTNKMKKELDLTDAQAERVKILNLKVSQKIKAIRDNSSYSDEMKKERIQGNKADYNTAMKSILTAEQWEKFEAMKQERKMMKKEKKTMEKSNN